MLILLVSPSGAGKTTFSLDLVKGNSDIIRLCPDEFRALYGKNESDQSVNHLVFSNLFIFTEYLLMANKTVLIDATNYNKKNRKKFIEIASDLKVKKICYYFSIPKETCKARNAARARIVPEYVIDRQFEGLEEPTLEEFDTIFTLDENGRVVNIEGENSVNREYFLPPGIGDMAWKNAELDAQTSRLAEELSKIVINKDLR